MKEAVGEGSMTVITIILVAGAIGAIAFIIGSLLGNQSRKANCENAGGYYKSGACYDYNDQECTINGDEYNCG